MFVQSLVLFLLSGFWFLTTINSGINEFSPLEKGLIISLVAAVLALQALTLFITTRLPPKWNARLGAMFAVVFATAAMQYAVSWGDELLMIVVGIVCVGVVGCLFAAGKRRFILRRESLLSFFAAVNLYCLNLAFVSAFQQLPPAAVAMLLAAAWWFFARVFFDSLTNAPMRKFIVAAAALLFAYQAALFPARAVVDAPSSPPGRTAAQHIRVVDFVRKPNVYFIALESVPPPSVLQMDLRLHASYDDRLRNLGFRRFRNAFSEVPGTQLAINFVAGMDAAYVRSLKPSARTGLFTGNEPAPLYEIFRANGYGINAYNRDFFMGPARGKFIDDYKTYSPLTLCGHFQATGSDFAGFFGYCILTAPQVMSFLGGDEFGAEPDENKVVDFYLDDFARKIADGKPQFFFARVQSAYHTSPFYRGGADEFAGFRALYADYVLQTEELTSRIARFADENDPDALMFVFSDHGAYLAAGGWDEHNATASSRKYFIRDRYAIYAAARAEGCGGYFDEVLSGGFATPPMIARGIVLCLSGGEDPAAGISYQLRRYDEAHTNEVEYGGPPTSYANYLYE